jgi:hypothetical protein
LATNGICNSFKVEVLQAIHCFNATLSGQSVTNTSGQAALTGITSTAGWSVGMGLSGTNVQANTVVAAIGGATSATMSLASSGGAVTSVTVTGDAFKMALVKVSPSTTFGPSTTNIGTPGSSASSQSNLGTDEAATGTGYTSGGMALTNVTPALSSTTATTSFSPSPSLTLTGSFACTAGIVYNNTTRGGAAAAPLNGRTCGVYDFGGTVSVGSSGGTMTFTMPTNAAGTALIQLA